MTTSSDHRTPPPQPSGEHWYELTATLPEKSTEALGDWLDNELRMLEDELERFVTPQSLRKSLRRA